MRQRAGDLPRSQAAEAAQDRQLEAQAQRMSHAPQAAGPVSARQGPAAQPTVPGLGQPLPAGLRAGLPRVGIDLDSLRIHHDEAAAQAADEAGARAYTQGRDIVFGRGQWQPQQAAGQALLAHEVTHAAQQAKAGAAPGVQCDPAPATGPGRAPPSEHFTTMPEGETGVEDGHVLFARDEVTLDATDRDALDALVVGAAPGAAVHVHGYASGEGDSDYNRNLAAHRAVAVKEYLEGILPAETRIVAYAYGETTAFGGRPQNRRVGIDLIEPGGMFNADSGNRFGLHLLPPEMLTLGGPSGPAGLSVTPGLPSLPGLPGLSAGSLLEEPAPGGPLAPRIRPGSLDDLLRTPPGLPFLEPPPFDHSSAAQTHIFRGLPYGTEEARSADELYRWWFGTYRWLGLGDLAAGAAQFSTNRTVGANLSMQAPTEQELLDRRMDTSPTTVGIPVDTVIRWMLDRR
jgi:outer membrane protein OmpA-like peptidoglycan-associated protein